MAECRTLARSRQARDVSGGADAFIGFGGVAVREKVRLGADWFVTDFGELLEALAATTASESSSQRGTTARP